MEVGAEGAQAPEKLHEDDRRQQSRWKTILYKILPFLENGNNAHLEIGGGAGGWGKLKLPLCCNGWAML